MIEIDGAAVKVADGVGIAEDAVDTGVSEGVRLIAAEGAVGLSEGVRPGPDECTAVGVGAAFVKGVAGAVAHPIARAAIMI